MEQNYQIDKLDRQILSFLLKDARIPFLEIARQLDVSGGTIHQRVEKMKDAGIITGSKITIDVKKLGHDVTVLLGIHLTNSRNLKTLLAKMRAIPEIVDVYYTTGGYGLIAKIQTKNIDSYHNFLVEKLQQMDEVRSTESFICLDHPINKDIGL